MKPIPKRKVANFAAENAKKKNQIKTRGKHATDSQRDAFIRLLVAISKATSFDLSHIMTFPITQYPLAIAHSDGLMIKTDKSMLLHSLEKKQEGFAEHVLPSFDVTLIDRGLLIHSFLSATGHILSFGSLATKLLISVCKGAITLRP